MFEWRNKASEGFVDHCSVGPRSLNPARNSVRRDPVAILSASRSAAGLMHSLPNFRLPLYSQRSHQRHLGSMREYGTVRSRKALPMRARRRQCMRVPPADLAVTRAASTVYAHYPTRDNKLAIVYIHTANDQIQKSSPFSTAAQRLIKCLELVGAYEYAQPGLKASLIWHLQRLEHGTALRGWPGPPVDRTHRCRIDTVASGDLTRQPYITYVTRNWRLIMYLSARVENGEASRCGPRCCVFLLNRHRALCVYMLCYLASSTRWRPRPPITDPRDLSDLFHAQSARCAACQFSVRATCAAELGEEFYYRDAPVRPECKMVLHLFDLNESVVEGSDGFTVRLGGAHACARREQGEVSRLPEQRGNEKRRREPGRWICRTCTDASAERTNEFAGRHECIL